MLSGESLAGPTIADTASHTRQLRPAIIASLLLHLALAFAVGRGALTQARTDEAAERSSVSVSIAVMRPERRIPTPDPVIPPEESTLETA